MKYVLLADMLGNKIVSPLCCKYPGTWQDQALAGSVMATKHDTIISKFHWLRLTSNVVPLKVDHILQNSWHFES